MGQAKAETVTRERSRDERPTAHALRDEAAVKLVNGRLVSKTLADPDMKSAVQQASKTVYASKKAFVEEMNRRGVLTRDGKLTKASGG